MRYSGEYGPGPALRKYSRRGSEKTGSHAGAARTILGDMMRSWLNEQQLARGSNPCSFMLPEDHKTIAGEAAPG